LASLATATAFLLTREVLMNEAGLYFPVRAYGTGYWVWLSSIGVACFGGMATAELSVGYKSAE